MDPSTDPSSKHVSHLWIVLGDQLDPDHPMLKDFDPEQDCVWMAEVRQESTKVWVHKARITLFLSAMRHYRDWLQEQNIPVLYHALDDETTFESFGEALHHTLAHHTVDRIRVVKLGEWSMEQTLLETAGAFKTPVDVVDDPHFYCDLGWFKDYAQGRKQLRMEYFYREMRKQHGILMTEGGEPEGGQWNFDKDNRGSFGKQGPQSLPAPVAIKPDTITQTVIGLVEQEFPDHSGQLDHFDWPVTPEDAQAVLDDFMSNRLAQFGQYQDAMWQNEPYLYHSRLSAAMNLKLINPRTIVEQVEKAYGQNKAPLAAVEGFIRQVIGWREYVRGIYWTYMPEYLNKNALNAQGQLPDFYWTGETEMECLSQALGQTLAYGYAHHIQRLMVTGLFALLLGVKPQYVHEWYLAVYVDAVEWVELPNTLGMSQFGDGGVMASKPYAATGKYIKRMSNYCDHCKYNPDEAVGDEACPFTTLYWDFLHRHRKLLSDNQRMGLQLKNLERLSEDRIQEITRKARRLKDQWTESQNHSPA